MEYEERRKSKAFLHFPPLICSQLPVVSDRSPETRSDWFDITMPIDGAPAADEDATAEQPEVGEEVAKRLERGKPLLWHGNAEVKHCFSLLARDSLAFRRKWFRSHWRHDFRYVLCFESSDFMLWTPTYDPLQVDLVDHSDFGMSSHASRGPWRC